MAVVSPTNITLQQQAGILTIEWADGRRCDYPVGPLRMACPCAECRGGHEFMGRQHEPKDLLALIPTQVYSVQRLEIVGNYALQFFWDDGHNSGIYTWEYLYRLCPETKASSE